MKLKNVAMILFTVAGVFLTSCIREDYSDCHNRYVVDLSYMGDGTDDIFLEKIGKVQMYIFDSGNRCIHEGTLTSEQVRRQEVMLPALEQGDYRIVFLGNTYSTQVRGLAEKDLSEIVFGSESYWKGQTVSGNDSLYWSSLDYTIEPFSIEQKVTRRTAEFASSHYDIIVEVIGVPESAMSDSPMIVLTGVSPYTDFTNTATVSEDAVYVPDAKHDGKDKVTASCNILRHLDHENVWLKILDASGKEIASVNFAEFIERHKDSIDCSKNEVVIPFRIAFNSSHTQVEVTIPDWWVIDVHPGYN